MPKFDVNAATSAVKINTAGSGKTYIKKMIDTSSRVVKRIPLDLIDDFPGHPFSVKDDNNMELLVDSVKQNGVITPIEVREKDGGRYELISGHRRRRASMLAGLTDIPAIIEDLTDEEATVRMVDANLQRDKILPSEKAFAYKMKLEALRAKGEKTGHKLRDLIGNGESGRTVQRYISLTRLIPEMLKLVDADKMPITIGVIFSSFTIEEQTMLLPFIKSKMPNNYIASELQDLSKMKILTEQNIRRTIYDRKVQPSTNEPAIQNILNKHENTSEGIKDSCEIEQKDIFENYIKIESSHDGILKNKISDKTSTTKFKNWNEDYNTIMNGYILKAVSLWNLENPSNKIQEETLNNVFTALRWATQELTAEEAYIYYKKE